MVETSLLARCKRAETGAWEELYENFASQVYRWALFFGIDTAGAEEVTQDVFATAFKRIDRCESDDQLPSWLFQTTRRHAANLRRTSWVRRISRTARSVEDVQDVLEGRVEHGALGFEMTRILRKMPVRLVEVLILHDLDGRTRDEISALLGVPAGTVASRLRKARSVFAQNWTRETGHE